MIGLPMGEVAASMGLSAIDCVADREGIGGGMNIRLGSSQCVLSSYQSEH
jgi:hypothetical protein